jgi:phosphohistidine phosphatase
MIKQLVVIRHAQAESHHKDFERELSAFGIKQIESIAKKISIQAIKIDKVLYSAAKRTKQSAEILVSQLGQKIAMEADDQLYLCSASYLYDAIAITDSSTSTLCLIGHNPGISEFVNSLIQTPIFKELETANVFVINLNIDNWTEIYQNNTSNYFNIVP